MHRRRTDSADGSVSDARATVFGRRLSVAQWLGLAILALGAMAMIADVWRFIDSVPAVRAAFVGGSVAALATALGALPVLFSQRLSDRIQDTLFGFGAGVMLAACAFSLIIPGLAAAQATAQFGGGQRGASLVIGLAVLLGGATIMLIDRVVPHEHFIKGREGQSPGKLRRTWLFVFAIALHNLPEGLAIGVGYAGNEGAVRANALAIGIAIQDVPEGLVVAVALLAAGYGRLWSVFIGAASGLIEPVGAVLGAAVTSHSHALLPWGLGFAAGAMLFVISHEIIPESHRKGHERFATAGLMIGFVLMMVLDTALG
ncbi:ZIP family metal transporter [Lysobacter capsici]|uniref:ZIP family metal transporter n=1 Tax=Lysobacter capsici TaxID=435897 RepID=UPI0009E60ABD|nr:ZIP family metal transporter [Lysobacter capsici]WND79985.1 ZIP family metal transporter [Lysobacter capsici]WND85181.1 ZIP family metal transporter [Lysobacter capsici]